MAATLASDRRPALGQHRWIGWFALAWLVGALAPLNAEYFASLWNSSQYRLFPLLLVGIAALMWKRCRDLGPVSAGHWCWTSLLMLTSLAVLAAAVTIDSPWLSAIASLGTLAALAYGSGGTQLVRALASSWLLLWLVIRPPLGLDDQLIRFLQALAVQWGSDALDLLGVIHAASGRIIEVPGHRLLTEEAGNGIRYLFGAMCCAAFLVVCGRRPLWSGLLVVASVPFWVVLGNALRVAAVAEFYVRWGVDGERGLVGVGVHVAIFLLILTFIVSVDRLLLFFTPVVETSQLPIEPVEPRVSRNGLLAPPMALLYAALVLLQAPMIVEHALNSLRQMPVSVPESTAATLPAKWGSWRRTKFESERRPAKSLDGENSRTWTYESPTCTAIASLDYPFWAWHDLPVCYEARGWQVQTPGDQTAASSERKSRKFVEIDLRHDIDSRYGMLLFELFDPADVPVAVLERDRRARLEARLDEARIRLQRLAKLEIVATSRKPLCQVQLLVSSYSPLAAQQRQEARDFFQLLCERLP